MTQAADAKGRIWAVAQEEFAAKGLAGARVDEIARRAEVNKALIYYYFKSKEKLLQAIISDFFAELLELKRTLAAGGCFTNSVYRQKVFRTVFGFLRQRKRVIRIILREMASGGAGTDQIIRMLEPLTDLYARHLAELGFAVGRRDAELTIGSTFFGLVPLLMFATLEDRMAQYLETDVDIAAEYYHKTASLVHEGLLQNLFVGKAQV